MFSIKLCDNFFSFSRFGFNDNSESTKDPDDEVNEYLMRAIDARSIDHLRAEHCKSVLLSFKDNALERKVKYSSSHSILSF